MPGAEGGVPMGCCWNCVGIQKVLPGIHCFLDERYSQSVQQELRGTPPVQCQRLRCGVWFCWGVFSCFLVLGVGFGFTEVCRKLL